MPKKDNLEMGPSLRGLGCRPHLRRFSLLDSSEVCWLSQDGQCQRSGVAGKLEANLQNAGEAQVISHHGHEAGAPRVPACRESGGWAGILFCGTGEELGHQWRQEGFPAVSMSNKVQEDCR